MPHTFSDKKKIYSVDMMFAYINLFQPKYKKIQLNLVINTINNKGWSCDNINYYSPKEVLKNPNKYKNEILRIKKSKLKYPIIINNNNLVIDGVHRLTKAFLLNKKTIKAYVFDEDIMKYFLINENKDYEIVNKLQIYNYIELFIQRFNLLEKNEQL